MKKIFLLVVLFFCLKSFAQYPISQGLGSANTIVRIPTPGAITGGLININFTDTTAANLTNIKFYAGAMIFTTSGGSKVWVRNSTATVWNQLSSSGGSTNIYNSDGTLTGNRQLDGGGNTLTFTNLSTFKLQATQTQIALPNKVLGLTDSVVVSDASNFVYKVPSNSFGSNNAWLITGNSGTTYASNFIGTTDSVGFFLRVNNKRSGMITPGGRTYFGYQAGLKDTLNDGDHSNENLQSSTAFGYKALANYSPLSISTQSANAAFGYEAMFSAVGTSGTDGNAAFGGRALYKDSSGRRNNAFGFNSQYWNITGVQNASMGFASGEINRSGVNNTSIGHATNRQGTQSSRLTSVGSTAGNLQGTSIIGVTITSGGSGYSGTVTVTFSAPEPTAPGFVGSIQATGTATLSGGAVSDVTMTNIGIGYIAANATVTFSGGGGTGATGTCITSIAGNNTMMGVESGVAQRVGVYNSYYGDRSGAGTGSNFAFVRDSFVTALGALTGKASATTRTNLTVIGYKAQGDCSNCLILGATGADQVNVGIGTLTPAAILHTVGTVRLASLGTSSSDTTTYKPVGRNSSGDIIGMTYWPGSGGGASQTFQNTLDVANGSILTHDNSIDATGFQLNFYSPSMTLGDVSSSRALLIIDSANRNVNGSVEEIGGTQSYFGVDGANKIAVLQSTGDAYVGDWNHYANNTYSEVDDEDSSFTFNGGVSGKGKLYLKVDDYSSKSNGYVLQLVDNTTGESGWINGTQNIYAVLPLHAKNDSTFEILGLSTIGTNGQSVLSDGSQWNYYTANQGSGAANRVTYWSATNTLTSNSQFTYDATTLGLTIPTTTGTTTSAGFSLVGNSLTTGTAFNMSSSSATSGTLLNLVLTGTATTSGNHALNIDVSGANAASSVNASALLVSNTRTGTTSTNQGVVSVASGGTTNIAGSFTANGGTNNYAIIVGSASGSVGIGTTSPTASEFQVTSSNTTASGTASSMVFVGNTLTTGTGFNLASSSLSSGSLMNMAITSTAAASGTQKGINISLSGNNATSSQATYGIYSDNSHGGTGGTNIAGYFTTSTGDNTYSLWAANGTYNSAVNRAAYIQGGLSVAGTFTTGTTSSSMIEVQSTTITSGTALYIPASALTSGNLIQLVGIGAGRAAGNELLDISNSGANTTNGITVTGARISVTNTNATSGTNIGLDITATGATTANYAIKLVDGTQGAGKLLTSDASGNASWTTPAATTLTVGTTPIASGTVGRVLFQGASSLLGESGNFFWDNTAGALYINASTAYGRLGQAIEVNRSANYGGLAVNTWSTDQFESPFFEFNKSKSGTIGTQADVVDGDYLGIINFRGSNTGSFRQGGGIIGRVNGTPGAGGIPLDLVFRVTNTSNSSAEVMAITSSERVKIGSLGTAPTEKLDVSGNVRFSGALMPNNDAGTSGYGLTSTGSGTAPIWKLLAGSVVASGNTTGQTTTNTIATYTTPNDGIVRVYDAACHLTVTAVTAGVLTTTVTYTDETNASRTITFFGMGLTSAGLTTTGVSNYPVSGEITAYPNTAITVTTTLTVGSSTYNQNASIRYIRNAQTL